MAKRFFLIVLDSFGVGELPDAYKWHDEGSNTLGAIRNHPNFNCPELERMGLLNIDGVGGGVSALKASYARMAEKSMGKDTTIGHWEIAGIVSPDPLPVYPDGFPEEIIQEFEEKTGRKVICNKPFSGTEVIKDYGLEHMRTGALIVIERRTKLGEHINGTVLCAVPSEKFFDTIFYNGTPLHDGAVIMRGGLIYAAACFLPTASKEETVDKALGARHRAAIGMSENSDAVIIVVSEETGKISVAENGLLKEDFSIFDLRPYLTSKQPTFSSFSESIRSGEFSAADAVCDACENFSDNSTGAIIIIERSNVLDQFLTDVTIIDALPTKEALGTIFYKGTAMSSQAVVIRDNLIHSAATINVPLPETLENKTLGARHKAAIGLSRCSDALVIVVSEETGTISVADNVKGDDFTRRGFDRNELRQYLTDKMNPKKPDTPPAQEKKAGEESPIAIIKRHMSKKAETSSDKEK